MYSERTPVCKVLLMGNVSVGKTSLMQRYMNDQFNASYKATIGVDFLNKTIELSDKSPLRLQLWDLAGSDTYSTMRSVYYRNAHGILIVVDPRQSNPVEQAEEWYDGYMDFASALVDGKKNPLIAVVINKIDCYDSDAELNDVVETMKVLTEHEEVIGIFTVSAKEGTGVEETITALVNAILERKLVTIDPDKTISLGENEGIQDDKCCH